MRLGAIVLQTKPWHELVGDFRTIESLGYDVVYVADHLTHPSMPGQWMGDGFCILAAAAAVTTKVDLGTLVASAAYRSPVPLARVAATVDDVCGGRLVLGLGAGTSGCAAAAGAHLDQRQLAERFADVVAGLLAIWRGDREFSGSTLSFDGVETAPLPPGRRPSMLMLAAHGRAGIDLVGRFADGWSTYGGPSSTALQPDDYWQLLAAQHRQVTDACERHGRDPHELRRSLLLGYGLVNPLTDTDAYLRAIDRADELGFDELVAYWPFGPPGSRFWSDPDVHATALERFHG